MTEDILDAAFKVHDHLDSALGRLDLDRLLSMVGRFLEQISLSGVRVPESGLRQQLRHLIRIWGHFVERHEGEFPNIYLLPPARRGKKNGQVTAKNLLRDWTRMVGQLENLLGPPEVGIQVLIAGPAGDPGGAQNEAKAREYLVEHYVTVQTLPQIEHYLRSGDLERALVKMAGLELCREDAALLTRKLEMVQDRIRLGTLSRGQAAVERTEIAEAIRASLIRAGPPL